MDDGVKKKDFEGATEGNATRAGLDWFHDQNQRRTRLKLVSVMVLPRLIDNWVATISYREVSVDAPRSSASPAGGS